MKKNHISEVDYQRDFDAIIESIFNETNFAKQPRYIIQIGAKSGHVLRHTFNLIQKQTYRAKHLLDYPLETIAITLKKTDALVNELVGLPCKIIEVSDLDSKTILKALEIENPQLALYLDFLAEEKPNFDDYTTLNSKYGIIQFRTLAAEKLLLDGAKASWFPKMGTSYSYPKREIVSKAALNHFELRNYVIREATQDDLKNLIAIEEACWPPPLRKSSAIISKRINEGQLVLEVKNEIIGVTYAQRISNIQVLDNVSVESLDEIADPKGSVIQLIALNILPKKHSHALEDQFLEFFLQKTLVIDGITEVASILMCQNYPGPDVISMESYVEELKLEKGSADLSTRLHVIHGAEIIKNVPSYRYEIGQSVLVVYKRELRTKLIKPTAVSTGSTFEEESSSDTIAQTVDMLVQRLIPSTISTKYSRNKSFIEMGIDSLRLLELRTLLSQEFAMVLSSNFFQRHETPEGVIKFFIETKLNPYKDWLYDIVWSSTAKPEVNSLKPNLIWIIIADEKEEIGSLIRSLLHENKQKCIFVKLSNKFAKTSEELYTIDPSSIDDYNKLFASIENLELLEGVIHLGNLEGRFVDPKEPNREELESAQKYAIEGLLHLVNSMALLRMTKAVRLWVIAQSITSDGTITSLLERPVNALCKIIREEYSKFDCKYISIEWQTEPVENSELIFDEIKSNSIEPQVAFIKGQRLVSRIIRASVESIRIPKFSPKASYLIVGGHRTLGIMLAQWYVSHGAKNLILIDNLDITPEVQVVIDELKNKGIKISNHTIDITNVNGLREALEKAYKHMPELKGVIHAAGLIDYDLLIHLNWNRFKEVYRLKIILSWDLHQLTKGIDLDHFILFSSCLSNFAPPGMAIQSIGNSFLDSLAFYRRACGLPVLTIDWGPWEVKHMEVKHMGISSLSDRMTGFTVEEGLRALNHLFYAPMPRIIVANLNWITLLQGSTQLNPFFDNIALEMGFKQEDIMEKFKETNPEMRQKLVQDYLHEKIRNLLKLRSSHQLETKSEFRKLGLDLSRLKVLENRIQSDLKNIIKLPYNFVESHVNLEELGTALTNLLNDLLEMSLKSKLEHPIAIIGLHDRKLTLDILDDKFSHLQIEELSKNSIKNLENDLKKDSKVKIIVIEDNLE